MIKSINVIRLFILFGIIIIIPKHTYTQNIENNFPPPEIPIKIKAVKVLNNIRLDGKLNENDWNNAEPVTEFFRTEPDQGGTYLYQTEAKFLYDDKNVYIGVFCKDSLGKKGIRVQDLRRDFSFGENDIIAIQFDAQNTKQYAVSFQTTPYGNQRDAQIFNGSNVDNDWNALWFVRTTRTDEGYYAEFAIPFKSLRYDKPIDDKPISWGFTIFRLARRDYEQTVFPAIPQSFFPYRMTYAAKLVDLEVPPPSANIRIEPYALYEYNEEKSGDNITRTAIELKVGGDIKWVVNPNTVLDLTINTDFAQADVDRAVNNLERFNIFFPERRQFFLENSGIWAGAGNSFIRPFFSRTIGLDNSFNATPTPIDVGARYTNRTDKESIAALVVRQRETDNSQASNFAVARYLKNYGKENNFGAMLTHRLNDGSNDLGLESDNNTTLTIDGSIRPKPELSINYMLSSSLDSETDNLGLSGRMFVGSTTNKHYIGYVNYFVSRDYSPDMGFVFQNDVMYHSAGGYSILRPKKWSFIRRWDPGAFFDLYHDFEGFGNFQQASLYIFPIFMWFKDNSFFEASFRPTWQNINFNFSPLGIQIEEDKYQYTRYTLRYNTDQSKKLSGSVRYNFGNFYNGTRNTINAGARFAPIPQAALNLNYEHNNINRLGLNNENLDTDLYSANLRLALNPRVQLSTFYQYNSFDEQGRWNVRFSWEYQPLSFIYLVFNDIETDVFDPTRQSKQFISKITFLKQF